MVADMKFTFWIPLFDGNNQLHSYRLQSVRQEKKWTRDGVQVCHGYVAIKREIERVAAKEISYGHPVLECMVCGMENQAGEFVFEMVFRDINSSHELHAAAQKAFRKFIRNYIKSHGLVAAAEAGLIKPNIITPEERERRDKRREEDNKPVFISCTQAELNKFFRIIGKKPVQIGTAKLSPESKEAIEVILAADHQPTKE